MSQVDALIAIVYVAIAVIIYLCVQIKYFVKNYVQDELDKQYDFYQKQLDSCAKSLHDVLTKSFEHCMSRTNDMHTDLMDEMDRKMDRLSEAIKLRADANWNYTVDIDERLNRDLGRILKLEKFVKNECALLKRVSDQLGNEFDEMYRENRMDDYFMNLLSDKVVSLCEQVATHNDLLEERLKRNDEKMRELSKQMRADAEYMVVLSSKVNMLENSNRELSSVTDSNSTDSDSEQRTTRSNLNVGKQISDELAVFLGKPIGTRMGRLDANKEIRDYIKSNGLARGRDIHPDEKLAQLLKVPTGVQLNYFNLQKYTKPHFI